MLVSPLRSTIQVGGTVQLTATGAGSGNPQWSSSLPTVARVSSTGLVTGVAAGTAIIKARKGNKSGSATVIVEGVPVPPPNIPPHPQLDLVSATGNTTNDVFTISTANTNDPDGSIVSWSLTQGDSTPPQTGSGTPQLTFALVWSAPGTYTVTLTVTDNVGATQAASIQIEVVDPGDPPPPPPPNVSPIAVLEYRSGQYTTDQHVVSIAGTRDPDTNLDTVVLNWGDGTTVSVPVPITVTEYSHVYAAQGTYVRTLTATDTLGLVGVATQTVTVIPPPVPPPDLPPVASLTLLAGTFANDLFSFSTAGSADPDGTLVSYSMIFGDGTGETGSVLPVQIDHTYTTAGTYSAKLTVRSNNGLTAEKTVTVTVQAPTPPPPGGTPLSRNEHPRLLMTLADLSSIGSNCSSGGAWGSSFQTAVTDIETNYWASISVTDANSLVYAFSMAGLVYNLRKAGVVSGVTFTKTNAEWLAKGVGWLMQTLTNTTVHQPARQVSHIAWEFWIGYDWLHDGLSGAQRQQIFSDMCVIGVGADSPYESYSAIVTFKQSAPGVQSSLNNARQWNSEITTRGWSRAITAALAMKGDNLTAGAFNSDTWCSEIISWYDAAFDSPADGQLNRESQRGGTDGSGIQGFGTYAFSYDHNWNTTMAWAWRTANGISKSTYYGAVGRSYFRGMIPYTFYMMRQQPHGSQKLLLKDLYSNADTHVGEYEIQVQMGHARAELQGVDNSAAALAAWFIANKGLDSEKRWVYSRFLAPSITAQSPAAVGLPLSKAFQPGQWQWRSGWLSNSDTIINVWGYQFSAFASAVGNFCIDYRGPAIITPGYGGHDLDTSWHGGGVNTLGCPELNRTTLETPEIHGDDFGFHRVYNNFVPNLVAGTIVDWMDRTEKFHAIDATDTYGYLWLDRTRSFNKTGLTDPLGSATKVGNDSVYRQFVVFQPPVVGTDPVIVFVFDQMTVLSHSPIFQKRNHTYYAGTPTVSGHSSSAAGPSRGAAGTTGKTTYSGGTPLITSSVTADGCDNKTWHRPFCFTSAFDVVLVEARRFNALVGWEYETPYGIMSVGSSLPGGGDLTKYIGIYRTEVIPTASNLTDRFGSVFVVGPSAMSAPTIEDWSGTSFNAMRANGYAAAIGTTAQNGTTSGTIICKTAGTYQLVIGNLTPGSTRTIAKGSNIASVTKINGGGTGPTYVVGSDGCLNVSVVVSSSGTGANNTLTVS